MEILETLKAEIITTYLAAFILLSYAIRKPARFLLNILLKKAKLTPVKEYTYGVFFVAFALALPFYFAGYDGFKLLLTYCFGVSLYDILIKHIIKTASGFLGASKPEAAEDV